LQALPADTDPRLRERLQNERDKAAERHRQLAMVVSKCNQWHMELRLPLGASLECQPPVNIKLQPGQTAAEAIASVRGEISALRSQIAQVSAAPLKRSSQEEAIAAYLERLTQHSKPRVGFDVRGNAKVSFVEDMVVDKTSVLGLLAWVLGPEQIAAAFARELCDAQEDEPPNAVSPAEREEKLAELSASLLLLERREAALLCEAHDMLPRSDMDPRAYLGVRIAPPPAAQVA
jgi:hypothetical protein